MKGSRLRVYRSALKHDVSREDIMHVLAHKRLEMFYREPSSWLVIGVDRAGRFIEVIYDLEQGNQFVFHAMKLRKAWYRLLDQRRK